MSKIGRSVTQSLGRVHQEKGEVHSAKQGLAPLQRLRHVSGQRGSDVGFQREMDHEGGRGQSKDHR